MITHIKGNLFSAPQEYALGHCISADCAMGAGIAKQFAMRYPELRAYCRSNNPEVGTTIRYNYKDRIIYNLITKEHYYNKPTYEDLAVALALMCFDCKINNIEHIAIPRIGCGLDQLKWDIVEPLIAGIFYNLNVRVYSL